MTVPHHTKTFHFDVALSFAGEDRAYVQSVAELLRKRGIRVFYDEYAMVELWGNDLYVLLDEVYRERARFAVVFVSRHYVDKPWTRHERQSAQARAFSEVGPYLLPVRLDDSELPGLRPTVAYIDARRTSAEELCAFIEEKLATVPGVTTVHAPPALRSPRTPEQIRELLALRPPAWEYLLYSGILWQRRQALEPKWRDHELGYARRARRHLNDRKALDFLGNAIDDFQACVAHITTMMPDAEAQERAFGPPGQPGDPALVEHLATRFVGVYEEILAIAAEIRGVGVSDELMPIFEATARLTDTPLREIREYVDRFVTEIDAIPERLGHDGAPIVIELDLILTVSKESLDALDREYKRARRRFGLDR
jgi:hypothetical protein